MDHNPHFPPNPNPSDSNMRDPEQSGTPFHRPDTHVHIRDPKPKEEKLKSFSGFLKDNSWKSYFKAVLYKVTANLVSAKVWFFLLPFIISTIYLGLNIDLQFEVINKILEQSLPKHDYRAVIELFRNLTNMFISWCTFTVSLAGTIVVVRESFKVSQLRAMKDEEPNKIKDMDV